MFRVAHRAVNVCGLRSRKVLVVIDLSIGVRADGQRALRRGMVADHWLGPRGELLVESAPFNYAMSQGLLGSQLLYCEHYVAAFFCFLRHAISCILLMPGGGWSPPPPPAAFFGTGGAPPFFAGPFAPALGTGGAPPPPAFCFLRHAISLLTTTVCVRRRVVRWLGQTVAVLTASCSCLLAARPLRQRLVLVCLALASADQGPASESAASANRPHLQPSASCAMPSP